MGDSLNPQAVGYYKRLVLVADRYVFLKRRVRKMETVLWLLITADVVLATLYFMGKIVYIG